MSCVRSFVRCAMRRSDGWQAHGLSNRSRQLTVTAQRRTARHWVVTIDCSLAQLQVVTTSNHKLRVTCECDWLTGWPRPIGLLYSRVWIICRLPYSRFIFSIALISSGLLKLSLVIFSCLMWQKHKLINRFLCGIFRGLRDLNNQPFRFERKRKRKQRVFSETDSLRCLKMGPGDSDRD